MEESLCQLFDQLSKPQISYEDITNGILQILQNPNAIFALINIARSTNLPNSIRNASLVFGYKFFSDLKDMQKDLPDYSSIKNHLFELLRNESDATIQKSICNLISIYAEYNSEISPWPELPFICINLIQIPEYQLIGLYLLNNIYEFFQPEECELVLPFYRQLSTSALLSADKEFRLQGYIAIEKHYIFTDDPETLSQIPNLINTLKMILQKCVYEIQDETECAYLFGMISYLISDQNLNLTECIPDFCNFVFTLINENVIPLQIKISSIQLIENLPFLLSLFFEENLERIIHDIIKLSLESCVEFGRDTEPYQFSTIFLNSLSSYVNSDLVFQVCYKFAMQLLVSNEPNQQQLSFFILSSIIENCSKSFLLCSNEIIPIVKKFILINDVPISINAMILLLGFITYIPETLYKYYDELVECLLQRIPFGNSLNILDLLLKKSNKSTKHLEQLLNNLLQLIIQNIDFKDSIISCISSSLLYCDPNENFYMILVPIFEKLIEDKSLLGPIYKCLGTISKVSPISTLNNLGNIVSIIYQNQNQFLELLPGLYKLIKQFPNEFQKFTEIINILIKLTDDNSNSLIAIKCLSYIQPDINFANCLIKKLNDPNVFDIHPEIIKIISASFPNLLKLPNFNCIELFNQIIFMIKQEEEFLEQEQVIKILKSIKLIISYDQMFSNNISETLIKLFINLLNENLLFLQNSDPTIKLIKTIYSLINRFIQINNNQNYLQPLIPVLTQIITTSEDKIKISFAVYSLTQISILLQQIEIFNFILSKIIPFLSLQENNSILMKNVFASFALMIKFSPQIMQQFQKQFNDSLGVLQLVINGSNEFADIYPEIVSLWSQCILRFNWNVSLDYVNTVLSFLDINNINFQNSLCLIELCCAKQLNDYGKKIAMKMTKYPPVVISLIPENLVSYLKSVLQSE